MKKRMSIMAIGLLLLGTILIGVAFPQQVGPFLKYEGNPILQPQGTGFEEKAVFNPAAIVRNDTLYLLYRAEDTTGAGQWNGTSRIGLAKSIDGTNFTRRPEPVIVPEYDYETPGGCEDPRIVKVGDTYYLTYTAYDGHTARLSLATSQDLIHWNKYGPILPSWGWSKAGAILPEEINSQYIMYFGDSNMWIAYSDDLINWTVDPNPVMRPRSGYFDANLVEPGPPPVLMEEGILLIYNGAGWSGDENAMDRAWDVDLSPDGDYAYIPGRGTSNAKVWIINISDLANPNVTNTIDIPTPLGKTPEAWGVQVVGNTLYVAAFQSGFWIYDITDPVNPTVVGSLVDSYTECRGLHVVGNYAYLADTWHGLSIVDIRNPANPTRISLYNTDQDIGSSYIGDPNSWYGEAEFHDVRVVNDTAYCAAGNFGLVIVDVHDKSNPNGVSFCCDVITQPRWPSGPYDWARGLQVQGNFVYMGDNRTGLRIIDVSNPVAPEEVGYYSLANLDMGEVWYPTIVGNRAYIGYQRAGFIILDISNPASPEPLGSYPMSGALVLASAVVSNIAHVVEETCLRILDVTDPSNIAQIGTTGAGRIFQYATGWVLFSKDDPTHILTRAEEPILVPEKDWERFGQVDNVVFSEGLVNYNDIWYLYYGGADTRIGVARCEGQIYIGVDEYEQREFLSYSLTQNYPNPFNVTISIEFSLKDCGKVSLKVLDLVGREVTTLVDRQMEAGTHRVIWKPVGLPSGVYFYVLSVNGLKELRKLIFLK